MAKPTYTNKQQLFPQQLHYTPQKFTQKTKQMQYSEHELCWLQNNGSLPVVLCIMATVNT